MYAPATTGHHGEATATSKAAGGLLRHCWCSSFLLGNHHLSNSHFLPGGNAKKEQESTSSKSSSSSSGSSSEVEVKAEDAAAWPTPQASAAAKKGARSKAKSWSQVVSGKK